MNTIMKKILIIDDDALIGKLLEIKLAEQGKYEVIRALDGEEGIKAIREQNPDLVLLDLMMPKKSGFEILEEMRRESLGAGMHIVVLTNLSGANDKDRALKMGGHSFFVKSENTIAGIVEYVLSKIE